MGSSESTCLALALPMARSSDWEIEHAVAAVTIATQLREK